MNKMNKKGFTLIEMLVVIAIIAVLVSIIIPVVGNSTAKAEAATNAANLRSAQAALTVGVLQKGKPDTAVTVDSDAEYQEWTGNSAAKMPVVKGNDGSTFSATIDTDGNVTVTFGTGKTIEYYAGIAGGEAATTPKNP